MSTYDLAEIVKTMTSSTIKHYATPGLTSLLVGADPAHGRVRLFCSDRDTREWITPHSHRFDFACLVLEGEVENILFLPVVNPSLYAKTNTYARGRLRAPAGGLGDYTVTRGTEPEHFAEMVTKYRVGDVYSMTADEIHSIRFSRGAQVLFFEGPPRFVDSDFLEPYSNGAVVPTFVSAPWMFTRDA
jgi:hypothetical protein